jgi:DMSO/TMAO reductase YedYZ molybdopterin-dependent catalytic subunit
VESGLARSRDSTDSIRGSNMSSFAPSTLDICSGWDLASAMHPQTLLGYEMNGHALGADHGAPLRLYLAIKLGYKGVKYLTEVNFLPTRCAVTRKTVELIGSRASEP